jgi:hypothetical protein
MKGSFFRCIAAALVVGAGACSVSSTGLSPTDASAGGASGSVVCPAGLTDQAAWPAKTSYTSCVRPCGPGGIVFETCSQIDRATCQAKRGCVCLEAPCVTCGDCPFQALPDCYLPTNGATATRCPDGVSEGGACAPACSQQLCLLADGKTGCVCGSKGTYACAEWNGANWQ